jgi:hypothetical protein
MSTSYCSQCGARLKPQSAYCPKCGAPAPVAAAAAPAKSPERGRGAAQKRRNVWLPVLLAAALLILAGGVLLALTQGESSQAVSQAPEAAGAVADEHGAEGLPYPDVPRISAVEAKARVGSGQALLVDVRSQGEYDTAHAAGATLLSLADLEVRYSELPQDKELIFYCT